MISKTTTKFWKYYEKLPDEIKEKSREIFEFFQKDPFHPSLHFKRVHSSKPIFSIRITKNYRAIGILEKNEIIWFWIGNHEEYEKIFKRL
jgi:mRNA-degrading endonuclease RelE of RelBE toxin-antitoxin system